MRPREWTISVALAINEIMRNLYGNWFSSYCNPRHFKSSRDGLGGCVKLGSYRSFQGYGVTAEGSLEEQPLSLEPSLFFMSDS